MHRFSLQSFISTLGAGLLLFGIAFGNTCWSKFCLTENWLLGIALLLITVAVITIFVKPDLRQNAENLISIPALGVLALLIGSASLANRTYTMFVDRFFLAEFFLVSIFSYILIRYCKQRSVLFLLLITIFLPSTLFLYSSNGALLFSDDHPSFFYRLTQLKSNFPDIPYYNPLWNGGVEAREFFPCGILNFFLLFSPLIYLFPLEQLYNYLLILLFFVVVPLSSLFAARLFGFSLIAGCFSAALATVPSLLWFRWALGYGTLGFITSAALFPLVIALVFKFFQAGEKPRFVHCCLLIFFTSLMLFWTPVVIALVPIAVLALFHLRQLFSSRYTLPALIILCAVNLPWMIIFIQASKVNSFLTQPAENTNDPSLAEQKVHTHQMGLKSSTSWKLRAHAATISWRHTRSVLRENFETFNPALLLLGLPGILLLRGGRKRFFITLLCWLFLLAAVIAPLKPRLELDRMFLVMLLLLALPAGLMAEKLYQKICNGFSFFALAALSLVAMSPLHLWYIMSKQTSEQFQFAKPIVHELATQIAEHAGEGRTLFAGFTLHELSTGHVAPLAYFTQKPLVATSYQHDTWEYTDVVPEEFRKAGHHGVLQYLRIMNISLIVTHDKFWKKWYRSKKKYFTSIWQSGRFELFKVNAPAQSYFVEGQGTVVSQKEGRIVLRLDDNQALLSFKYLPFLQVEGCELSSRELYPGGQFIALTNCERNTDIEIHALPPLRRFFLPH